MDHRLVRQFGRVIEGQSMDEETAKMVVIALTAVGVVAWLAGLTVMLRATRERRARADDSVDQYDMEGPPSPGTITGRAEVEGEPGALTTKLAERLARDGLGFFGPVKILTCSPKEVTFEAAGTNLGAGGYAGSGFRRGRVRFAGSGTRTRVDYAVETSSRGILLALGWVALALGLAALIAAPWLEFTYVLPNPNLRTQAIQTVQMVHFLWPPFLFAFLSGQPGRVVRAQMEALVNNLPYI
jgi:hypothetical protein